MRRLQLDVYAWRAALSIEDDAPQAGGGTVAEPPAEATAQPFEASRRGLVFATAREAVVPLEVEFHDRPPPPPGAEWDLVVDATVSSPSGRLAMVFPQDELQMVVFAVGPGLHAIRVCGADVDAADPLADDGPDRYRLQIWPAAEHRNPEAVRLPAFLGPTGEPRFR